MHPRFFLVLQFAIFSAVFVCGCDSRPKPAFQSPRRIVLLEFLPPAEDYVVSIPLLSTNDDSVFEGDLGNFRGEVTVGTLLSNASEWRLELRFRGTQAVTSPVDLTNVLRLRYPHAARLTMPAIGTIRGRFLSDQELLRYAQ